MKYPSLEEAVADFVAIGCAHTPRALGAVNMPEGFALMLDPDFMYYFYVSVDGESVSHWNRWVIYRGAKAKAAQGGVNRER